MGAEMRTEKVMPRGTPAPRKPMDKGTAEQEQNGVAMPRSAARTLPKDSFLPASTRLGEEAAQNAHAEDHQGQ